MIITNFDSTMSRRFINGKGLSVFFPYKLGKNIHYPYNVILFHLKNFYIGFIGTVPNNNGKAKTKRRISFEYIETDITFR